MRLFRSSSAAASAVNPQPKIRRSHACFSTLDSRPFVPRPLRLVLTKEGTLKTMKFLLAVLLIGGCVAAVVYLVVRSDRAVRALTISVLRDLPKSFLVLESSEQLAVATINSGGWILGPRIGQVVAERTSYWGIDLTQIKADQIEVDGTRVRVPLPAPSMLDVAVDLSTLQFFTKRSGLQLLGDLAMGRSLEKDLMELVYRSHPEPMPDEIESRRLEFVARLNRDTARLFGSRGLSVEFR
jgi:hypothetical protein